DLGGHAVGVHLLVALRGVERTAQPFLVLGFPVRDVVVVQPHLLVAVRVTFREVLVERRVIARIEIRPIVLAREARVRIGGDDDVVVAHRASRLPSTDRSSYRWCTYGNNWSEGTRSTTSPCWLLAIRANSIDTIRPTGMSAIGSS